MKKFLILAAITALSLSSCNEVVDETDEAKGSTIDRKGTVDIKYSQVIRDSNIILTTTKNFYTQRGVIFRTAITTDTLPSLGFQTDTLSTGRENEDGDDVDTVFTHKKTYQLYISVK